MPKAFKILQKWRNIAKSGHTESTIHDFWFLNLIYFLKTNFSQSFAFRNLVPFWAWCEGRGWGDVMWGKWVMEGWAGWEFNFRTIFSLSFRSLFAIRFPLSLSLSLKTRFPDLTLPPPFLFVKKIFFYF